MRFVFLCTASCVLAVAAGGASPAGKNILEQKVASVLPSPKEERWLQVPWRTSVLQARNEAQQLGKPLFFWIMNGNPLGCT